MVKIGVIGLGYVGLPLAIAFAKKFSSVVGFDISCEKVTKLKECHDYTGELSDGELENTNLKITCDVSDLSDVNFYIVAVPTPIDKAHRPDLTPVIKASETVGSVLKRGDIVVYESTVYPGVTEEICGDILAEISDLSVGEDFYLGYSPERINPGDKVHKLENVTKIVSGQDERTLELIADVYSKVIKVGVHKASSIKVAEAAKVIENTQRDINIALMNELAIIFNKMGINTQDVLAAANTKWNFLKFTPGLVGGHCIGVDPYYLTYRAEELGYIPQVILAGRRINDGMGKYIAEQTVKTLAKMNKDIVGSKIGVFGLAFKENVPDLRNSRVPDILLELKEYGVSILVNDYLANIEDAKQEYGIVLNDMEELNDLDAIIIAVAHDDYVKHGAEMFLSRLKDYTGVIIDVKSVLDKNEIPEQVGYWSL
ncbi:nucleotide sugar dehydrogenase [Anaerosinus massiliensis]|uniref:nucleotide sugar dehydrogenase n=1 Tax=Massilibacillus massiliensis TaxID=1806837 RepID=UPI000A63020C|nr:nucleotide sugar dehydrogenase [Massilibacillus massiliensis]